MSNIIVLGAGMVGSAIAIDLAKKHSVTLTDLSLDRLDNIKHKFGGLKIQQLDVTNKNDLQNIIKAV